MTWSYSADKHQALVEFLQLRASAAIPGLCYEQLAILSHEISGFLQGILVGRFCFCFTS